MLRHRPVRVAGAVLEGSHHVCAFFNSKSEEYRTLLPFVKEGFEHGDRAFHIINETFRAEHVWRLEDIGINVAHAQRERQLEIRGWQDAYLRGGRFDLDAMLTVVDDVLEGGRAQGFQLTRLVANMEWALEDRPGVHDLVAYEARLNPVLAKYDDPVVCTYDLTRFDAAVVLDVLRTHPAVIIGGVLYTNPLFVAPDQLLRERHERVIPAGGTVNATPLTSIDPQELRRGMRELVVLSALPAAWESTSTARIPESLAEVLLKSVEAEFIWVHLNTGPEGHAVDIARTAQDNGLHRADDVSRVLSQSVNLDDAIGAVVIPHSLAGGSMRIAMQRIGPEGESGFLIAASRRPDFPTQTARLLLEVGGRQAAATLEARHAEKALRQSQHQHRPALVAADHAIPFEEERFEPVSNGLGAAEAERSELEQRFDLLTPREREVLRLVVMGLANKQVATTLGVSEPTVKVHRGQIMRKMRAGSLAELLIMSVTLGLAYPSS